MTEYTTKTGVLFTRSRKRKLRVKFEFRLTLSGSKSANKRIADNRCVEKLRQMFNKRLYRDIFDWPEDDVVLEIEEIPTETYIQEKGTSGQPDFIRGPDVFEFNCTGNAGGCTISARMREPHKQKLRKRCNIGSILSNKEKGKKEKGRVFKKKIYPKPANKGNKKLKYIFYRPVFEVDVLTENQDVELILTLKVLQNDPGLILIRDASFPPLNIQESITEFSKKKIRSIFNAHWRQLIGVSTLTEFEKINIPNLQFYTKSTTEVLSVFLDYTKINATEVDPDFGTIGEL